MKVSRQRNDPVGVELRNKEEEVEGKQSRDCPDPAVFLAQSACFLTPPV